MIEINTSPRLLTQLPLFKPNGSHSASAGITDRFHRTAHHMLGFSANHVLFLPDDVIIIRFMDECDFDIDDLVQSVEKQIPACP